jgi:hypothetical protein
VTFGAQWPHKGLSNSRVLRLPSPAPSALLSSSRWLAAVSIEFPGGSCSSSSSFARFFHEAAFPLFSTNKALTGSVSFNYSVPLPLYMYNLKYTLTVARRSPCRRRTPTLSSVCLSYPPACSAAKIHARWRRRTAIVVSAAPSRLRRIPSTGTSSWARSEPFRSCPWGLSSP